MLLFIRMLLLLLLLSCRLKREVAPLVVYNIDVLRTFGSANYCGI